MTVDDIITELEHGSYFHPTRMLTIFISSQTLISLFYKTENLYLNRTSTKSMIESDFWFSQQPPGDDSSAHGFFRIQKSQQGAKILAF